MHNSKPKQLNFTISFVCFQLYCDFLNVLQISFLIILYISDSVVDDKPVITYSPKGRIVEEKAVKFECKLNFNLQTISNKGKASEDYSLKIHTIWTHFYQSSQDTVVRSCFSLFFKFCYTHTVTSV